MKEIKSEEEFDELVSQNKPFFFMKHSLTCPISAKAFDEYKRFDREDVGEEHYYLAIQDARSLSQHVTDFSGVKHESPQVIQFKDGKPVWHTSHFDITSNNLSKQIG
jgi:bacillithiol system protein YtxJ